MWFLRRRSVKRSRRSLTGAEQFESRTMLSGNVNVVFEGNDIRLVGDAEANDIQIEGDNGILRITGANDTTIDFGTDPVEIDLAAEEYDDLRIATLGGDDVVTISGEIDLPGRLIVYTHWDNDQILIDGMHSFGDDVVIAGGGHSDIISVNNVAAGDKFIVNGDDGGVRNQGDDEVTISNSSSVDDTKVFAGFGTNTVALSNVDVGRDLRMWGSSGDDQFTVGSTSVGRNLFILTGSGADSIGLAGVDVGRDVRLFGGKDADVIALFGDLTDDQSNPVGGNTVGRNLSIIGFQRDDDVLIEGSTNVAGGVYLYGLGGNDRLDRATGLTDDEVTREISFEDTVLHDEAVAVVDTLRTALTPTTA